MMSHPQNNKGRATLRINHGKIDSRPDYEGIEASLKTLDGIAEVSVNKVADLVKVEYDPEKLTLDEIRLRLQRAEKR
jgi:Heavy-metal-associated domain